jgi:hypothetical protein
MTDGILSRKELKVDLGINLGQFELKTFNHVVQFMPGVYYLFNSDTGKKESKYRGMDKTFDPLKAKDILWKEFREEKLKDPQGKLIKDDTGKVKIIKHGCYPVNINVFVTRNLALHQPNKYNDHRYEFYPVLKEEEFSLRSKRLPGKKGFRLLKKEQFKFFSPKHANAMELLMMGSKPYVLDLNYENDYDDADTEESMLDENKLNTLMETDRYDLKG